MAQASDLTIFLISCGDNPNYADALRALQAQTAVRDGARIEEIRNLAPMSRAFQAMLDRCQTRFFIQCDEDMLLIPEAAEQMLNGIQNPPLTHEGHTAFACFLLHDVHFDMDIQGVKIYDHAIMRKCPYDLSIISCEKDQLNRIRAAGYKIFESPVVMGLHSPKWTTELIFERYFDLMEKWKLFGYSWLEDMPRKLLEKYTHDPSEINSYAFLGAWASASRPEKLRDREKNFLIRTPEYLRARGWFSQPMQATLYLTDKCNLKCGWCLRQGEMAGVSPAPPFCPTIVDELLRRFPSIQAICLCGFGEPLLHPDLAGVIDRCKQHGLWTGLITNGVLLQEAFPMLCEHRPSAISISLNAASAEEHAAETGVSGAWQKVMAGVDAWREHRKTLRKLRADDRGIPLTLSRVCTAQNLDGIPAFLRLAVELEVDSIDLHNILPHDVGTPEKEAAFLQTVLTVAHRETINAMKSLPGANLVRNWPVLIDPDTPTRYCESPFSTISVDGNRNIGVCNSVMPPQAENGNLRNAKCRQNDYCQRMRMMFGEPELPAWCKWCFRNYR
jgi:MoaA/NifB/PqqE/SkfB family radical SAM enzyme